MNRRISRRISASEKPLRDYVKCLQIYPTPERAPIADLKTLSFIIEREEALRLVALIVNLFSPACQEIEIKADRRKKALSVTSRTAPNLYMADKKRLI
jgi:hypothetical protein